MAGDKKRETQRLDTWCFSVIVPRAILKLWLWVGGCAVDFGMFAVAMNAILLKFDNLDDILWVGS